MHADVDDDGKLRQRYTNKRVNAAKENIGFSLTYDEFVKLFRESCITSSMCGVRGYHLARHGDTGPYAYGNCEFKHYLENAKEKRITDASRAASRRNADLAHHATQALPAHVVSSRIKAGQARSASVAALREEQAKKREQRNLAKHASYSSARNSQYMTFWITDGTTNMKWCDSRGSLPAGYRRGRTV